MVTTAKGSGEAHQHNHRHRHPHRHRHRHRHGHSHRHHHHRHGHGHSHHAHHHHHNDMAHADLSEVQPSNVGGIEIYADAVCVNAGSGTSCGYGLVCDEPHARIAEPISCSPRGERHYLHALHAALRFAEGVRSRMVTIYLPHPPTVHYYNNWLQRWMASDFRQKGKRAPRLSGHDVWRQIYMSKMALADRAVELHVDHMKRRSENKMREAQTLAQLGTRMHVVCTLCKRTHARNFLAHPCQPICNYDLCKNRRFPDMATYQNHLEMWHQRDCPSEDCEEGLGIYSDKDLKNHLKEEHGMKYGCDFCGRLFDCRVRFRNHPKQCPQGERCRDCGLRFTSRRQANMHREKAAHGEYEDGSDYESDESSTSSTSSTTTSSFSSDYDFLQFATSRYR